MGVSSVTPLDAIGLGWSIIPIRLDKKPYYDLLPEGPDGAATWKPYQKRLATADEIKEWTTANPPAFAIATGKVSHLIAFDFDGDKGLELAQQWGVRPHRRSGSGGMHWDVQHPGWHVPTLNGKAKKELGQRWPGLDVKGDGGYVIAFGRNAIGRYEWLREPGPDDASLVPLEVWEFLRAHRDQPQWSQEPNIGGRRDPCPPDAGLVNQERLIRRALDQVSSNGRNNSGFWLSSQLRDNGYTIGEAETAMLNFCRQCPSTNTREHGNRIPNKRFGQASKRHIRVRPVSRGGINKSERSRKPVWPRQHPHLRALRNGPT